MQQPENAGADPSGAAEAAWLVRYSDPPEFERRLAALPPSPARDVVDAFHAWRRQNLAAALDLTLRTPASCAPGTRWDLRARSIQAAVLTEMGLLREAAECQLRELELAEASGDPLAVLSAVHDLGALYGHTDAEASEAQLVRAIALARAVRTGSDLERRDALSVEALAVVNLYENAREYGVGVPEDIPSLAEAEMLVTDVWPELAALIRAVRAFDLLERDDIAGAKALVSGLPDPAGMRDVVHGVFVARTIALVAGRDGRPDDGLQVVESLISQAPIEHVGFLHESALELHRARGDVAAALDAAVECLRVTKELHHRRATEHVRALEVWHRTASAERAAQAAAAEADAARIAGRTDPLTGLANRSALDEWLEATPARGTQLAVIDLDRFKQVNDTAGHRVGDDALRDVAEALRGAIREGDRCARSGGDEFVVVRTTSTQPLAVDLRAIAPLPEPITLSIGVAITTGDESAQAALDRADRFMYIAKRAGGDRVVDEPEVPKA